MKYEFNLYLDPVIFVLKLDLDIAKRYICTLKMLLALTLKRFGLNKQSQTQADTTEIIISPHILVVIIVNGRLFQADNSESLKGRSYRKNLCR